MTLDTRAASLTDLIRAAGAPEGVSVRQTGDTFSIVYPDATTAAQRAAGDAAAAAFDPSAAAEQARQDAADPDKVTLRTQGAQAVSDNNAFLALALPTNAQTLAQVKAFTRQMNAVLKFLNRYTG